jgi:hypothetical protein
MIGVVSYLNVSRQVLKSSRTCGSSSQLSTGSKQKILFGDIRNNLRSESLPIISSLSGVFSAHNNLTNHIFKI